MTKSEFRNYIKDKIILLDGATGSNLQKRGMPNGVCPELWISEHPDVLIGLQKEYVEAGSNIIYAPTFGANRIKLAGYGLADRAEELNKLLVSLSKQAADKKALVAGDITMTGQQLEPLGDLTFGELVEVYKEQIAYIKEAGADLIVVETMMSLQETRAAVIAAGDVDADLPIIATMTFAESGNTLFGASAESAVVVLQELGVDAVGMNCSAGPDKMMPILERMAKVATVPLIAKPNAGLPTVDADGNTCYDMGADVFAEAMKQMMISGAHICGGCCGSDPAFIGALKTLATNGKPTDFSNDTIYLANEREVYGFTSGQELELGDGIDFSKDEELMEEYADGAFDTAQDLAFDLQDDEADALLFCAEGMENEAAVLTEAIAEVTSMVRMPVVIASSNPEVIDTVLRGFSGLAGVKFLTDDPDKQEALTDLRKRYGAKLITIDNKISC